MSASQKRRETSVESEEPQWQSGRLSEEEGEISEPAGERFAVSDDDVFDDLLKEVEEDRVKSKVVRVAPKKNRQGRHVRFEQDLDSDDANFRRNARDKRSKGARKEGRVGRRGDNRLARKKARKARKARRAASTSSLSSSSESEESEGSSSEDSASDSSVSSTESRRKKRKSRRKAKKHQKLPSRIVKAVREAIGKAPDFIGGGDATSRQLADLTQIIELVQDNRNKKAVKRLKARIALLRAAQGSEARFAALEANYVAQGWAGAENPTSAAIAAVGPLFARTSQARVRFPVRRAYSSRQTDRCYNCQGEGHRARDCRQPKKSV